MNYAELHNASDETLCRLSRAGVRDAEGILAARYLTLVRACARDFKPIDGSPEDLAQEGMIGLLHAIRSSDRSRGAFAAFAKKCVRNSIVDALRRSARKKHIPLNTYLPLELEGGTTPSPEQALLDRESYLERLAAMRAALSELENTVLWLYLEGYTPEQIAKNTGKSRKSMENALSRVKKKLKYIFICPV